MTTTIRGIDGVTMQPDLFTTTPPAPAHYRRTDPATSRDAAQRVRANRLEQVVLDWLESQGAHGSHGGVWAECCGHHRAGGWHRRRGEFSRGETSF